MRNSWEGHIVKMRLEEGRDYKECLRRTIGDQPKKMYQTIITPYKVSLEK